MKDADKVTMTFGQLKRLVKEAINKPVCIRRKLHEDASDDQDLQSWIGGYLYNAPQAFYGTDAHDLAEQFIDEVETDLSIDEVETEIEYAQSKVYDE